MAMIFDSPLGGILYMPPVSKFPDVPSFAVFKLGLRVLALGS